MAYLLYELLWFMIGIVSFPFYIISGFIRKKPVLKYFNPLSRHEAKQLDGKKIIWVHAVSVGETVVANTVLRELLKKEFKGYQLIFTTHTPTGQAMARKLIGDIAVLAYFPLDFPWLMHNFIKRIKPEIFLFFETEIWPNAIRFSKESGAKVILVNGRISDRSYRKYLKVKSFLKSVFSYVDLFLMQSDEDAERIANLGANPDLIAVTGNVKFDQEYPKFDSNQIHAFKEEYGWEKNLIFAAASTHKGEEEIILAAYLKLKKEMPFVLILAPRHPERLPEIEALVQNFRLSYVRRTANQAGTNPEVLLLDTFGELGIVYAAADIVFVGGSLVNVGGHNILEAAIQEKPVLYGKYMQNFKESKRLLEEAGAGFTVHDETEIIKTVSELLKNKEKYKILGSKAKEVILKNKGASQKITRLIGGILN